jgi:hypothetical protein
MKKIVKAFVAASILGGALAAAFGSSTVANAAPAVQQQEDDGAALRCPTGCWLVPPKGCECWQ